MTSDAASGRQRAKAIWDRVERVLIARAAPVFSIALLVAAVVGIRATDWTGVLAMLPTRPAFWLVFAAAYATPALCDWVIYRRLWSIPVGGIAELFRKMVSNELLVGYSGEASLYAWARRSGRDGGAALAALKDVSILSAAVGSLVTLTALAMTVPQWGRLHLPVPGWASLLGLGAVLALPLVALVWSRRVFRLSRRELAIVSGVHGVRALLTNGLTVAMWHCVLPGVPAATWGVLLTVKLLVSRLPFVSNRELIFASTAALLLGAGAPLAAMTTLLATLTTATHIAVALLLSVKWRTGSSGQSATCRPASA